MSTMDMTEVMKRVMEEILTSKDRGLLRAYGRCGKCQTMVNAEFDRTEEIRGKIVECPGCGAMAAVERGAVDNIPG